MEKQLPARKRQALEMRSRIQNVALDLFDRDGFENVSVEQIAQAAGCSVGNIYHYFKSKPTPASPPAASCWTSWAARWTSAAKTPPCTAALSMG